MGTVGGVIVLIMLLAGIFSGFLSPYPFNEIHPGDFLHPPSAQYLLGTDNLGRDLLSRILGGARTSMIVGLASPAISILVSIIIGGMSGFIGSKFDMVVPPFIDALICFP